jgi:hypothetical protein
VLHRLERDQHVVRQQRQEVQAEACREEHHPAGRGHRDEGLAAHQFAAEIVPGLAGAQPDQRRQQRRAEEQAQRHGPAALRVGLAAAHVVRRQHVERPHQAQRHGEAERAGPLGLLVQSQQRGQAQAGGQPGEFVPEELAGVRKNGVHRRWTSS